MPKDWLELHDLDNTKPKLEQRLEIVQKGLLLGRLTIRFVKSGVGVPLWGSKLRG